jgi:hypothetical protein
LPEVQGGCCIRIPLCHFLARQRPPRKLIHKMAFKASRLLTFILQGIWVMRRVRGVGRRPVAGETVTPGVRRPWYRSHRYRV